MRKQIVLGTKNQDKLRELKALLRGSRIEVLSLDDFPMCPDVHEDGKTFEQNAKKKARFYATHTGELTLADDSGLMVPALRGKPGVYSARFAGVRCSYRNNNDKLLGLLKNAKGPKRRAMFVCVMALYHGKKKIGVVRGECHGRIAYAEKGNNGFGYDPVFIPKGFSKTFAELSRASKNRVSHRSRALRAAKRVILNYFKSLP